MRPLGLSHMLRRLVDAAGWASGGWRVQLSHSVTRSQPLARRHRTTAPMLRLDDRPSSRPRARGRNDERRRQASASHLVARERPVCSICLADFTDSDPSASQAPHRRIGSLCVCVCVDAVAHRSLANTFG